MGPAQNEDELGLNGSRGGGEDWKFNGSWNLDQLKLGEPGCSEEP